MSDRVGTLHKMNGTTLKKENPHNRLVKESFSNQS